MSEPILLLGPRRKRRANGSGQNDAVQNPHRKVRFEEVHYIEGSHDDATDLPSLEELGNSLKNKTTLKKWRVMMNDPSNSKLVIAPIDCPQQRVTIHYEKLRAEPTEDEVPQAAPLDVHLAEPEEPQVKGDSQNSEPKPKQPRRVSGSIVKVTPVSLESRLEEILRPENDDAVLSQSELTVVPCRSGILEKSAIVIDDSNIKCRVEKLYFDSRRLKAMAEIVRH